MGTLGEHPVRNVSRRRPQRTQITGECLDWSFVGIEGFF
jgi:hypothetical protein